eukprot:1919237-Rhodomonas_salina.1
MSGDSRTQQDTAAHKQYTQYTAVHSSTQQYTAVHTKNGSSCLRFCAITCVLCCSCAAEAEYIIFEEGAETAGDCQDLQHATTRRNKQQH